MSAQLFDLGVRLRAEATGRPAPRMRFAPRLPPTRPVAVTVERHRRAGTVIEAAAPAPAGATTHSAIGRGSGALSALTTLGVGPHADTVPTLVVADRASLDALASLARRTAPGDADADAAAVVAWWDQRADHAGTGSVLVAAATAAERWSLGTAPEAETDAATWLRWLGITAPGPVGLLALAEAVTAGETLPGLDQTAETEQASWDYLRERVPTGWDWRWRDTPTEAALGLATRTHAAELFDSLRLGDPLWAQRECHAGTVVSGTVTERTERGLTLSSDQPLCRLRVDSDIEGWAGPPTSVTDPARLRFAGRLTGSTVTPAGGVRLTLTSPRGRAAPAVGDPVTLRPAPVQPSGQRFARRTLSGRYAHRDNWLATGRNPTPRRRAVPLDVLIAAAD